ncbi:MAG: hypothetical protein QOI63_920, partial [Thermoplasmata archaeon]|nr:hypothetical protein [Thermoplasmata archaeon]
MSTASGTRIVLLFAAVIGLGVA